MVRVHHLIPIRRTFLLLLTAGLLAGCGIVPRSRMEESQKLAQLLRSENARLKDQNLALQSQNRDYADRAVDDLRRLTAREQAIEGLERSVQALQEDRERLAAAYEQFTASLGQRPDPARPGADRKEPERPSPKGITSMDDGNTGR